MRLTGTTTSSLIFFGDSVRSAGESALRAAHNFDTSSASAATARSIKPAPRAAREIASIAASSAASSPSASISNSAPASGTASPACARASRKRLAVEKFERARRRRLRHDARDRGGSGCDVDVGCAQRACRGRQRRQLERRFGDDRERAFRADQETRQVVTGGAFRGRFAGSGNPRRCRPPRAARARCRASRRISLRADRPRCRRGFRRSCSTAPKSDRAARTDA